jgi:hypothetical protein
MLGMKCQEEKNLQKEVFNCEIEYIVKTLKKFIIPQNQIKPSYSTFYPRITSLKLFKAF